MGVDQKALGWLTSTSSSLFSNDVCLNPTRTGSKGLPGCQKRGPES